MAPDPSPSSPSSSSSSAALPSASTSTATALGMTLTEPSAVSSAPPGPSEQGRSAAPSPVQSPPAAPQSPQQSSAPSEPQATPPKTAAQQASEAAAAAGAESTSKASPSPSTPTRSPITRTYGSAGKNAQSQSPSQQQSAAPHSSSPAGANAVNDSPSSVRSSGASSTTSSSSSPSSSPTAPSQPTSRRVKVYKLKGEAWIDLGTGTCAGVFLQGSEDDDDLDAELDGLVGLSDGGSRRRVRDDDEGAWIVVRREGGVKKGENGSEGDKQAASAASPTKGKGSSEVGEDKMLVDRGAEEEDKVQKEDENGSEVPSSPPPQPAESYILRTRVQPYPLGYNPDDLLLRDEDEITSLDDSGNATVDAGGYQRQQDTLIVWTERGGGIEGEEDDEVEMALSFATSSGCSEMWEFIKAARRFAAEQQALHSPSPSPSLSSDERAFPLHSTNSTFSSLTTLPEPSLGNLSTLEAAIRNISRTTVGRERAANIIVRSGFLDKLVKVHGEAEDLESLEDLHALCRVMQTILLLNDSALFDLVIKDDYILGVVGMLEYDPDFPTMRASYRAHLSTATAFIPVVPLALIPAPLLAKIHATHRLHYLKDVVLARILEDSTFSMLNSHIYFNEVDIVNEIAGAREVVRLVFQVLEAGKEEDEGRGGAGKGEESRGRDTTIGANGKGKERERDLGLGPKRTIGPELPDDLLASRKKARLSSPPASTFTASSSAAPPPPDSSSTSTSISPAALPAPTPVIPPPSSSHLPKLHATLFLLQLSQMAKNLQLPVRTQFYKTMCDRGLLSALEGALRFADRLTTSSKTTTTMTATGEAETAEEREVRLARAEDAKTMRTAALSLWMVVVDLAAPEVRAYCFRQGKAIEAAADAAMEELEGDAIDDAIARAGEEEGEGEKHAGEKTMLGVLIGMFQREEDLGTKTQLAEALRVLVDVAGEGGPLEAPPRLRQEDPEAEKFLQYFYDHLMLSLVQPLMDLPERKDSDPPLVLSSSRTALLSHICDLLCFFISHHTFRSKYLVLSNPQLAKSVARLLRPTPKLTRHTHLRLAALRFIRSIVARTDDFYNRFLVKHDLIRPVLATADEEKDKDNLLGSACLEFFEYLRTANSKALLNHVMDRAGDQVRRLAAGTDSSPPLRTFTSLIQRWEMNNEPPPAPSVSVSAAGGDSNGVGGDGVSGGGATSSSMQRQRSTPAGWAPRMEREEEAYFEDDDYDDDFGKGADVREDAVLAGASFGSSRRNKRGRETTNDPFGPTVPSSSSATAAEPSSSSTANSTAEGGETSKFSSSPETEAKRPKLDDEAEEGSSPLPRSKTLPGGGGDGKGASLVDAMTGATGGEGNEKMKVEAEDPGMAGGFIREPEASSSNGDSASSSSSSNAPPPLLSLGELKRKKEEEEDGELGLLAKKKPSPSPSTPRPTLSHNPFLPKPPSGSASTSAPKSGGFKISFGGIKSKFAGGGKKE